MPLLETPSEFPCWKHLQNAPVVLFMTDLARQSLVMHKKHISCCDDDDVNLGVVGGANESRPYARTSKIAKLRKFCAIKYTPHSNSVLSCTFAHCTKPARFQAGGEEPPSRYPGHLPSRDAHRAVLPYLISEWWTGV